MRNSGHLLTFENIGNNGCKMPITSLRFSFHRAPTKNCYKKREKKNVKKIQRQISGKTAKHS